jgi:hypothetical protein
MMSLPKRNQLVEIQRRRSEHMPHIGLAPIARSNRIVPLRQRYGPIGEKIHDHLNLG